MLSLFFLTEQRKLFRPLSPQYILQQIIFKPGVIVKLSRRYIIGILLLAGCAKSPAPLPAVSPDTNVLVDMGPPLTGPYGSYIRQAANRYNIDEILVQAIIQVESSYNPKAVSTSNAIGLMQIKAETAGRDAYRLQGRYGEPTQFELMDTEMNIDLGSAYIKVLQQQQLVGITNPKTLYYATIVSYVNGAGAMLRTFSSDKQDAVNQINQLTPEEFYQHIQSNHPAPQAPRYLWKVDTAYLALRQ